MQNKILPAIAVAVFNKDGEILLQKRKSQLWGLISGHVEFGESVTAAALREVQEETGLRAGIKRFIGIYSAPETQTYNSGDGLYQYVTHYFEAALLEPFNAAFCNDETMELNFFAPANIPADLILMHPMWLQDALTTEGIFIR